MFEKIKELVAQQLGIEADTIKPESNFKDDLNADSLDLFELIMSLEEEYSIEIPTEELETLTTVQAVIDYLEAHGANA
ncbi:MAG: acyl carrier protein [Lachnospira sp.]